MVNYSCQKLVLILLLSLFSINSFAELVVKSLSADTALMPAGQNMEIFFSVTDSSSEYEYFLLSTLDDQSSMLEPAIKDETGAELKLRFDLPAPILSLSYSLIVRKGLEIVTSTPVVELKRDCFPVLSSSAQTEVVGKLPEEMYEQAKQLENDFANYEQVFMQLDHLNSILNQESE